MKTLEQLFVEVRQWHNNDCVGNLTIFRAPRSEMVDVVGEQVIKLREMDQEAHDAVCKVFDLFDSERVELFRDKEGYPDRIKIIRRF
jgi:hypothetical protein